MISLITLTLLMFEFQYSNGHTLPRKGTLKNVDVYSIQGSNNESITLVSSKSKNPTVKEITYFHVIERPYEKSQVMVTHTEETDEGPVFDDTKRPFTNSHGYQFSNLDSDDDHDDNTSEETESSDEDNSQSSEDLFADDDDGSDSDDNASEVGDDESNSNEDTESDENISDSGDDEASKTDEEDSNKKDDVSEEYTDDATDLADEEEYNENDRIDKEPVESITSTEQTVSSEVISEGTESVESSTVKMTEPSREQSTSEAETVLVTTEPVSTTAVDDVANEKKAARNMLFNQLRDRYQKSLKPSKESSRKKRKAEYVEHEDDDDDDMKLPEMPEAPRLPELNYDQLPSYVREMISTTKPVIHEQNKNNNEETDKEIERRIEEVINEVMRPYEEELEEEEDGSQEEKAKKPRTYGMKLKAGKGYVWNDLLGNPGMSFDVGDSPTHSSEEDNEENLDERPEYEIEPYDKDTYEEIQTDDDSKPSLEDILINKNKDKIDDNDKEIQETEDYLVKEEDKLKDTTESSLHDKKLEHTNNKMNESQEKEIKKEINHKKCDKPLQRDGLDHKDTTEKSVDESTETNHEKIDLNTEKEESLNKEKNTEEDKETHKPKRLESMLELLKDQDEDFWMWLQDWTSTYMDLLMKHIKKIVKHEVKKQIELNKEGSNQDKTSEKSEPAIETQTDEKDTEQAQEITKDGSIIVDGDKIPLTHNTNFDLSDDRVDDNIKSDLLKGRRHKEKEKENNITPEVSLVQTESNNKKPDSNNVTDVISKEEGSVEAKNIFGNSYNNEKVTNIYIFYPNANAKKMIEDLTSDKGNKSNTLIFGHSENTNVEQREETSTENKKEEPKPIKEESAVITDKIDEITAPITSTGEKETSPATESSSTNEDSKNKEDKSGNDKELEEIHKENSAEKKDSTIDEKDTTSEKDINLVTESSNTVENKVDESEKNVKELEETPKESNLDKEKSATDKEDTSEKDLHGVDSLAKVENSASDLI